MKPTHKTQRHFIVGDEWIYYKIYTGYNTSDQILINILKPIISKLLKNKIVDKWFYIRYSDPNPHIRLRLHINDKENIGVVLSSFFQKLKKHLEEDIIWKIQLETYNRELERYGFENIELAENIFYHDSEMIINFLTYNEDDNLRWLFSLKAIDDFLTIFKYSKNQKLALLESLKLGFYNEFKPSKEDKKSINQKYATHKKEIENILNTDLNSQNILNDFLILIKTRNKNIAATVTLLLRANKNNSLNIELDYLLSSFIHMTMNRIFISKNRTYELVCYDFLFKHYKTDLLKKNQEA